MDGLLIGYCLSSASGQTSLTATASLPVVNWGLNVTEYSWSGSAINIDGAATGTFSNTATGSPSGVARTLGCVTLNGDVILQWIRGDAITAVSGGYSSPAEFDGDVAGYAGKINTGVGSAPTWTQTSFAYEIASVAFCGT